MSEVQRASALLFGSIFCLLTLVADGAAAGF
jgi:hypothetical protein